MPNYKETEVIGTKYRRCYGVHIDNKLDSVASVTFAEEEVTITDTGSESKMVSGCKMLFDASGSIDVYDAETGIPTGGTISHGELYDIIYSMYMSAATRRDAAMARDDLTPEQITALRNGEPI